jgi:serine/threonine protein kinase
MIKTVDPNMQNACFKRFIPETMDIIQKMLIKNPDSRITPDEALNHPYFVKLGFTKNGQNNKKVQKHLNVMFENINNDNPN